MVVVLPERHALGEPAPVLDVLVDGLTAQLVELGDAELLDLLLARDAELLLDLELDGEAVRVPARLALDVVALHRPVARDHVLVGARQHVVGAGLAVGGGWTLVEDEPRAALSQL